MIPTKQQIEKEIKRLRQFIDAGIDTKELDKIIESRVAYFAETLLRWTQEDTEGWNLPLEEAIEESKLIMQDIEAKSV